MKKYLIILTFFALMLSSCKSLQTYYEVCDVQSSLPQTARGAYEFKNSSCAISYDFWGNNGDAGFVFTNNTDEIIYVDLSKSFFIRNGEAYDYYLGRTISSSSAISSSSSVSKSGTAYGFWQNGFALLPGSISANIGSNSAASKSNTIEFAEKSVIAIPPHTSKYFCEYNAASSLFYDCEHNITPSKKETPTYSFDKTNSPLTFGNYITYKIGDNGEEQTINNDFYVKSITFYHADAAIVHQTVGCPNDTRTIDVVKDSSPARFYIRYERETRSSFNNNVRGPKGNTKRTNDYWDY